MLPAEELVSNWKAFGYIERFVKSEEKIGKDLFYTVCTQHVMNYQQNFRIVEGIWSHLKSRQIRKRPILPHMCATCSELLTCITVS